MISACRGVSRSSFLKTDLKPNSLSHQKKFVTQEIFFEISHIKFINREQFVEEFADSYEEDKKTKKDICIGLMNFRNKH